MIVLKLDAEDLRQLIREEIGKVVKQPDKIITCEGEINPLHPDGHPRYSFNEIQGKKFK